LRRKKSRSKSRTRKSIDKVKSSLDLKATKLEKSNKILKEKNKKMKQSIKEKDFEINYLGNQLKNKKMEIEELNKFILDLKEALSQKDRIISNLVKKNEQISMLQSYSKENFVKKSMEVDKSGDSVLSQFIQRIKLYGKDTKTSFSEDTGVN
jgi:chromosome segregation ATPase